MWPSKTLPSKAFFNSATFPTLWTDFNTVPDDGMLRSSHITGSFFVEQLAKGSWVRLVDDEGYSCVGRIHKIRGDLFYLEPDWSTWTVPAVSMLASPVPAYTSEPQLVPAYPNQPQLVTAGEQVAFHLGGGALATS